MKVEGGEGVRLALFHEAVQKPAGHLTLQHIRRGNKEVGGKQLSTKSMKLNYAYHFCLHSGG